MLFCLVIFFEMHWRKNSKFVEEELIVCKNILWVLLWHDLIGRQKGIKRMHTEPLFLSCGMSVLCLQKGSRYIMGIGHIICLLWSFERWEVQDGRRVVVFAGTQGDGDAARPISRISTIWHTMHRSTCLPNELHWVDFGCRCSKKKNKVLSPFCCARNWKQHGNIVGLPVSCSLMVAQVSGSCAAIFISTLKEKRHARRRVGYQEDSFHCFEFRIMWRLFWSPREEWIPT